MRRRSLSISLYQATATSIILAKVGNLQLASGSLLANRFEIDCVAGSGGMGTVYRARDRYSGDVVALKLLHEDSDGPDKGERFAHEAQLLSELRHPGIVAHVAHGQTPQGQRFLAMQWLDGETLAQRLAHGPLALSDALLLTQRVAEALAFTHQHGILHRDLKPSNLFLPGGGIDRVQILDFGIARRLTTPRAMTRTGMIIGTPEYMAPEQARCVRELTPAVDLFSLGCVLYECLTGTPPFVAEHFAAVLVRILFEEPSPVEDRRPGIPKAVSALVHRLLAKDCAVRIGDARELTAALASIGDLPDSPLPPTLDAPRRAAPVKPDSEQVLLSLVLAVTPGAVDGLSATELPSDVRSDIEQRGALLSELRSLGVQADLLLGGALVATMPQMPSAKDQAARAARCAGKIKEHWPEAQIVVVTGRGSRSQGNLSGEVLDRAWRMLGKLETAPPADSTAQIRIDEVSAGLLEGRFELSAVPNLSRAYALGGERLDPDAARLLLGKPTPCVGRERELTTLDAVYNECKEDRLARAVLILGPPGMGKSRVRHEFVRRLERQGERTVILIGRGDPMKTGSAYGMLGEALRQRMDLRDGQSLPKQRARLRERIGAALPTADAPRVTVFIGEICGVPFPDEESPQLRAARQDPRIMSDQVEQAWLDGLRLFRSEEPLLLILEDLHWSDALTVKLVDAALRRLRDQAFMVLALARPEVWELYPNLWAGTVQALPLHPLAKKAGERLVRQILGIDLAAERVAHLVEQSAGNPLFLEELIRAVAEGKTGALPETVAAMIQARISRLPQGTRRALRAASVLGEIFWENAIGHLLAATHGEEPIQSVLTELIREEIVDKSIERRFIEETQYRFRHALVRDAVYGLVSPEEKITWHAAAGAFLETAGEREAIVLAEHFRLGQEMTQAVTAYVKAAEQAYDAGDMDGALVSVERGLACGATGEERGVLLSFQCQISLWREQVDQVLTVGPEALALLRPGSKPACQVLYPLFVSSLYLQPIRLPELLTQLLSLKPEPTARPAYFLSVSILALVFAGAGQKNTATLLRQKLHVLSKTLLTYEHNEWAHLLIVEGTLHCFMTGLPYQCLKQFQDAEPALRQAGNRQMQMYAQHNAGSALARLGHQAAALELLQTNLALIGQTKDALILANARVRLAEVLSQTSTYEDWSAAENLATLGTETKSLDMRGSAHYILARVAYLRGDLSRAASEFQIANEILTPLPPYRVDGIPLWSTVLSLQGKEPMSLRVCTEAAHEADALGIEPIGFLALLVALSEAQSRAAMPEAARQTVERALPILRRRVADIPDSAWRATYLRNVPENVRLLELAEQGGCDIADLRQAAGSAAT